jgi:hypothetical protein
MNYALGRAACLNLQAFTGQSARDEHGPALVMSQGFATVDQLLRNYLKVHGFEI